MDMLWWHWLVLGLVLAVLEMVSAGGFFIIFFGAGALVVGMFSAVGLAGPLWAQWLLFSVLSILSLVLFRDPLLRRVRASTPPLPVDRLVGDVAIALDDLPIGKVGRAELRGSAWTAKNEGTTTISKGQRCKVQRVDGLTLHITAEGV
jgi:membrane protein implicated in regulation of membrane protease activity